ncbi:hypothetical protein [Nannocystis pusilla]|uniref:hypothetical protein n=1 Tax=Nannocystis pusilla TaxID=889268 RepID=UPI003B7F1E2D
MRHPAGPLRARRPVLGPRGRRRHGRGQAGQDPLYDQNHNPVGSVVGGFHNLRSYSGPAEQCEFRWLWLADAYKP